VLDRSTSRKTGIQRILGDGLACAAARVSSKTRSSPLPLRAVPIPDFQTLMLPALRVLGEHDEQSPQEVISQLADTFHLTPSEREELLPSGRVRLLDNRVHWAVIYMQRAGLVAKPRRAVWRATGEGRQVLGENPARVDIAFLRARSPEFVRWQRGTAPDGKAVERPMVAEGSLSDTPEELLERVWTGLREQVSADLLEAIRDRREDSKFFEELVVQVLHKMGYGGTFPEAARAIGRSGDGGIDGVIKEDRLGLDTVYVQAKNQDATVGRPEIQKFAGSLEGEHAQKGVFITTSTFSSEAREFVKRIGRRIVLIEGHELAELMIEHRVGVTAHREYVVPKLDPTFFEE